MIPYDLPPAFMVIFMFLYGAVLGSFLTVCVHRLPQHEGLWDAWKSLIHSPSHCDRCHQRLLVRDNVPIFGWLILRGRCRFCKRGIPGRYPLIELTNGLLFVLVYWMEIPFDRWVGITGSCLTTTLSPASPDTGLGWSGIAMVNARVIFHLILVEALFVASLIDWDLMIIPDSVTLPPMLMGVAGSALFGKFWLVPVWFQDPSVTRAVTGWLTGERPTRAVLAPIPEWIGLHPHWHGLAVSLAGLIIGGGVIWGIRLIGHAALKREAMGFGDVVLMAMVGSFLGWQPTVVAIFLSAFLAMLLVLATRLTTWNHEIPFGPFLSLGTVTTLLGWRWIWPRVEMYFSLGVLLPFFAVLMTGCLFVTLLGVRALKRLLGYPVDFDELDFGEWTSADQLSHFAGETVNEDQGQWPRESWPGKFTGRGQSQERQWQRPNDNGWRRHWNQRR